jgi:hypothetical protein
MNKLGELKKLDKLLAQHEPEIAKHCQIVKLEQNCLFVIVDSGNWTTQLRFQIPSLMRKLNQYPGLEKLSGIICKTRPHHTLSTSTKPRTRTAAACLTPETAENVLETAKTIKDEKLRATMEKIAGNLIKK